MRGQLMSFQQVQCVFIIKHYLTCPCLACQAVFVHQFPVPCTWQTLHLFHKHFHDTWSSVDCVISWSISITMRRHLKSWFISAEIHYHRAHLWWIKNLPIYGATISGLFIYKSWLPSTSIRWKFCLLMNSSKSVITSSIVPVILGRDDRTARMGHFASFNIWKLEKTYIIRISSCFK